MVKALLLASLGKKNFWLVDALTALKPAAWALGSATPSNGLDGPLARCQHWPSPGPRPGTQRGWARHTHTRIRTPVPGTLPSTGVDDTTTTPLALAQLPTPRARSHCPLLACRPLWPLPVTDRELCALWLQGLPLPCPTVRGPGPVGCWVDVGSLVSGLGPLVSGVSGVSGALPLGPWSLYP